jgi:hypothetical protein
MASYNVKEDVFSEVSEEFAASVFRDLSSILVVAEEQQGK